MKLVTTTLLCFFLYFNPAFAQPDWTSIVPGVFAELDAETVDSIRAIRERCDTIRARMNGLIQKKGLDPKQVFSYGLANFKEGLSNQDATEPNGFYQIKVRDEEIRQLERWHIDLYRLDVTLQRWIKINEKLKKHPDRTQYARWALLHRNLPPQEMRALNNPDLAHGWVLDVVVCDVVAALDATRPDQVNGKMRSFNLKFDSELMDSLDRTKDMRSWQFPVPPEVIICSMPMNGAYAFSRDESIPGVGYVILPRSANQALSPIVYSQTTWRARWCSARGRITYTPMEVRDGHQFFFNLPDRYFKNGELYRLEIIATPKVSAASMMPAEVCLQAFRGNTQSELPTRISLPDEVKITELYFRASTQGLYPRKDQVIGKVDWFAGTIAFETENPFDAFEMYGAGKIKPEVSFTVNTQAFYALEKALRSSALYYYLSVPTVEPLDQLPLDQFAAAELDNTFKMPFIENVNKGATETYITQSTGAIHPRMNLPGGYYVPGWSQVFAPDTLVSNPPVPFITRPMYEKNKEPVTTKFSCELRVGEFIQIVNTIKLHKQQIERRIEERSRFLMELDRRDALRRGAPFNGTLADYRKREIENLPPDVKAVRDCKFPDAIRDHFGLFYSRFFPGSKQRSAELNIKITD